MGKFGMELINERDWTSLFQDFPMAKTHKLGLTWTTKSLFSIGFALISTTKKYITHCLLSGRSQVQLPPRTLAFRLRDPSHLASVDFHN